MTAGPAELLALAQEGAYGFLSVFLRIGAVMAVMPAFGETVVPARVRLALAVAFTAIVGPAVIPGLPAPPGTLPDAVAFGGTEMATGLALGLILRLSVLCLMTAGAIIAQSASLAQMFTAAGTEPMPAVGHLLVIAGLALATLGGLHVQIAAALIRSYDILPAGRLPDALLMHRWSLQHVGAGFALAFRLAAPFLVAAVACNLGLGAINRAMPHLSVAFVGAPAMTLGAVVLMVIALPGGLLVWQGAFAALLADPFGAVR